MKVSHNYEIFICEIVMWNWNHSYMKVAHMKFLYVKSVSLMNGPIAHDDFTYEILTWENIFIHEIFTCENNFKNMKSKTPIYVDYL